MLLGADQHVLGTLSICNLAVWLCVFIVCLSVRLLALRAHLHVLRKPDHSCTSKRDPLPSHS